MAFLKPSRPTSLLGLTLEGRRLEGVVLGRPNGTLKVAKTFQTTLSLDPLTNDPELVGREIRNHLDEAGIRERRCAVCIPLQWALTLQSKIPQIPEADVASFLQLEAERGFPYAPADLSLSITRFSSGTGEQHALIVAVPKSHLTLLEKVLRAARLKPLSFSLAISALQKPNEEPKSGLLTLALGENSVELQVSAGGGVAAMRALEGAFEMEGSARRVDAGLIAREIRITLGQLPKDLREMISRIEVFGPEDTARRLVKEMLPVARDMGLLIGAGTASPVDGYRVQAPDRGAALAAFCLAARRLAGMSPGFEFLPPKESAWTRMATRFSSRKILYAGASAAALILLVCGAFLWQQWRLTVLGSKWDAVKLRVTELETMRQQASKFRPWFDESARSLRIIQRITEAFPEDGSVSAKSLKVKDLSEITCEGQARDNQACLGLLERLGKVPQIKDTLKVQQVVTGKSPLKFTLSFNWSEGAGHEH
jgi:hypothetical protein